MGAPPRYPAPSRTVVRTAGGLYNGSYGPRRDGGSVGTTGEERDVRTGDFAVRGRRWTPGASWSLALVPLLALFELLLLHLADTGGLSAAVALAATAAAVTAFAAGSLLAARLVPVVPRTRVRTALRERERRTAFLPQRDPDAAGRPRPRAPGRSLLTAV